MAETLPSADELLPSLFDELPGDVVYQQLKAANGSFELACAKLLVIRATYRLGAAPDAAPAQPLLAPGKEDDDRAPAARGGPPLEMSKRERVRLDMIEVYTQHNPAKVREAVDGELEDDDRRLGARGFRHRVEAERRHLGARGRHAKVERADLAPARDAQRGGEKLDVGHELGLAIPRPAARAVAYQA